MAERKPELSYLMPSRMLRAKDPWCDPCSTSAIMEGPVYLVTLDGVRLWGKLRRCCICHTRVWTTLKGNVIPVKEMSTTPYP